MGIQKFYKSRFAFIQVIQKNNPRVNPWLVIFLIVTQLLAPMSSDLSGIAIADEVSPTQVRSEDLLGVARPIGESSQALGNANANIENRNAVLDLVQNNTPTLVTQTPRPTEESVDSQGRRVTRQYGNPDGTVLVSTFNSSNFLIEERSLDNLNRVTRLSLFNGARSSRRTEATDFTYHGNTQVVRTETVLVANDLNKIKSRKSFSESGAHLSDERFNSSGIRTTQTFFRDGTTTIQRIVQYHPSGIQIRTDEVFSENGKIKTTFSLEGVKTREQEFNTAGFETRRTDFSDSTGVKTAETLFDAAGKKLSSTTFDATTGIKIVEKEFNAAEIEIRRTTFSASTGFRTSERLSDAAGKKLSNTTFDAATGAKTREQEFNSAEIEIRRTDFSVSTGLKTSETLFDETGKKLSMTTFDPTTGTKTREDVFDAAGRPFRITTFDPITGFRVLEVTHVYAAATGSKKTTTTVNFDSQGNPPIAPPLLVAPALPVEPVSSVEQTVVASPVAVPSVTASPAPEVIPAETQVRGVTPPNESASLTEPATTATPSQTASPAQRAPEETLDSQGRRTSLVSFDNQGHVSQTEYFSYDDRGRVTRLTLFDGSSTPIRTAVTNFTYHGDTQVARTEVTLDPSTLSIQSRKDFNESGVHLSTTTFNSSGGRIRTVFFLNNGTRRIVNYDPEEGTQIPVEEVLSESGSIKTTFSPRGVRLLEQEFNTAGRELKATTFNPTTGIRTQEDTYIYTPNLPDSERTFSTINFDSQGKIINAFAIEETLDSQGRRGSLVSFNNQGQAIQTEYFSYDGQGRLTETRTLQSNGNLVSRVIHQHDNPDGTVLVSTFNASDFLIEERSVDTLNRVTRLVLFNGLSRLSRTAATDFTYHANTQIVRTETLFEPLTLRTENRKNFSESGVHLSTERFNSAGNKIRETFFREGTTIIQRVVRYHPMSTQIRTDEVFNESGRVMTTFSPVGVRIQEQEFNTADIEIRRADFSESTGMKASERVFDATGRILSLTNFHPTTGLRTKEFIYSYASANTDVFEIYTVNFDAQGNAINPRPIQIGEPEILQPTLPTEQSGLEVVRSTESIVQTPELLARAAYLQQIQEQFGSNYDATLQVSSTDPTKIDVIIETKSGVTVATGKVKNLRYTAQSLEDHTFRVLENTVTVTAEGVKSRRGLTSNSFSDLQDATFNGEALYRGLTMLPGDINPITKLSQITLGYISRNHDDNHSRDQYRFVDAGKFWDIDFFFTFPRPDKPSVLNTVTLTEVTTPANVQSYIQNLQTQLAPSYVLEVPTPLNSDYVRNVTITAQGSVPEGRLKSLSYTIVSDPSGTGPITVAGTITAVISGGPNNPDVTPFNGRIILNGLEKLPGNLDPIASFSRATFTYFNDTVGRYDFSLDGSLWAISLEDPSKPLSEAVNLTYDPPAPTPTNLLITTDQIGPAELAARAAADAARAAQQEAIESVNLARLAVQNATTANDRAAAEAALADAIFQELEARDQVEATRLAEAQFRVARTLARSESERQAREASINARNEANQNRILELAAQTRASIDAEILAARARASAPPTPTELASRAATEAVRLATSEANATIRPARGVISENSPEALAARNLAIDATLERFRTAAEAGTALNLSQVESDAREVRLEARQAAVEAYTLARENAEAIRVESFAAARETLIAAERAADLFSANARQAVVYGFTSRTATDYAAELARQTISIETARTAYNNALEVARQEKETAYAVAQEALEHAQIIADASYNGVNLVLSVVRTMDRLFSSARTLTFSHQVRTDTLRKAVAAARLAEDTARSSGNAPLETALATAQESIRTANQTFLQTETAADEVLRQAKAAADEVLRQAKAAADQTTREAVGAAKSIRDLELLAALGRLQRAGETYINAYYQAETFATEAVRATYTNSYIAQNTAYDAAEMTHRSAVAAAREAHTIMITSGKEVLASAISSAREPLQNILAENNSQTTSTRINAREAITAVVQSAVNFARTTTLDQRNRVIQVRTLNSSGQITQSVNTEYHGDTLVASTITTLNRQLRETQVRTFDPDGQIIQTIDTTYHGISAFANTITTRNAQDRITQIRMFNSNGSLVSREERQYDPSGASLTQVFNTAGFLTEERSLDELNRLTRLISFNGARSQRRTAVTDFAYHLNTQIVSTETILDPSDLNPLNLKIKNRKSFSETGAHLSTEIFNSSGNRTTQTFFRDGTTVVQRIVRYHSPGIQIQTDEVFNADGGKIKTTFSSSGVKTREEEFEGFNDSLRVLRLTTFSANTGLRTREIVYTYDSQNRRTSHAVNFDSNGNPK